MTRVRWRRPEPDAWEARCGQIALLVFVDECGAWSWWIARAATLERPRRRRGDRDPEAGCGPSSRPSAPTFRDGLRALARAVGA